MIPAAASALDRDSVALVTQIGPVSREFLDPAPAGRVPGYLLKSVEDGVRLATGL